MDNEQNMTGIQYISQNNGLIKYIDYDNKTVIYKSKGFGAEGVALCCAPLYENEIKTEQQIQSSSTDGISTDKPKFGYSRYL